MQYNILHPSKLPGIKEILMKQIFRCVSIPAFFFFIFFTIHPLYADVPHPHGIKTDGSLGSAGTVSIPGPDYEIKSEYGQQTASNLFHSFQQFNLHSGESAVFTGPSSVQRIISRVTGGQSSWINGQIISAIEGADLYLLNASGFMFGPDASLDISGSFHVSTADYLRMGEYERFYSRPTEGEILSVVAPAAFGFLNDDNASITLEGRGWITEEEWYENCPTGLYVPEGENISLIAGNIDIRRGTMYEAEVTDEEGNPYYVQETDEYGWPLYEIETDENGEYIYDEEGYPVYVLDEYGEPVPVLLLDEEGNPVPETEIIQPGELAVPGGRINLAAVTSAGEVFPTAEGMDISAEETGTVRMSENALADVSGDSGGSVFIRSGTFVMEQSGVLANTYEGDGAGIDIQTETFVMADGAYLKANTYGFGKGGSIRVQAGGDVRLSGEDAMGAVSGIFSNSRAEESAGDGGDIQIKSETLSVLDGNQIQAGTLGTGKGGTIHVEAGNSVIVSGENSFGDVSGIVVNSQSVFENAGKGGDIVIKTPELLIGNGAHIASSSWEGEGGNIEITASAAVTISGEDSYAYPSMIESAGIGTGKGGDIQIKTKNLLLEKGGTVNSSAYGEGQGGNVFIETGDTVQVSGETESGEFLSSIASDTYGEDEYAGDGGTIDIRSGNLLLESGGQIGAASFGAGNGGDVRVNSASVNISGVSISNPDYASGIFVNAQGGENAGNGGSIALAADSLNIFENGSISAGTGGSGTGGSIYVRAGTAFICSDGRIEAESQGAGDAGNIEMDNAGNLLMNGGSITTKTTEADGGNIRLTSAGYLYMKDSRINTSVEDKFGDGGNITLQVPFLIQKNSPVIAQAVGGDGGNIHIETNAIYPFPPESQSPIDASSQLGVDGIVSINSPETDISSSLTVLPSHFMDATQWAKTPCAARSGESVSTFIFYGKDAIPSPPDDWQPGPLLQSENAEMNDSLPAEDKMEP